MKIGLDCLKNIRSYSVTANKYNRNPSVDSPLNMRDDVKPAFWDRSTADCCRAYSNISFGANPLSLDKQLKLIADKYQKMGLIVSIKENFIENLVQKLLNQQCKSPLIFFVEGASGSGKSTHAKIISEIVNKLMNKSGESSLIISGDNFYTANEKFMKEANYIFVEMIKKHPERETNSAFDIESVYRVLTGMRDAKSDIVRIPVFDHKIAKPVAAREVKKPDKLVIFDGLYAPEDFVFDARIFIDTDRSVRDARVGGERFRKRNPSSKNPEEDGKALAKIVGDVHERFIVPNKAKADIVISGNEDLQLVTKMYEELISCCYAYLHK